MFLVVRIEIPIDPFAARSPFEIRSVSSKQLWGMDASNSILPIHRTHSNSLYLGRKSSVAYGAFERSFLRMAPVMDLQRGVARKCLVADITCGVSTHCNRSYLFTIASRHFHTLLPSVKAICNPRFERKLSVTNARGEREREVFNLIV